MIIRNNYSIRIIAFICCLVQFSCQTSQKEATSVRQRLSINEGWSFYKYKSDITADHLIYDVRPEIKNEDDTKEADSRPTDAVEVDTKQAVLKPWILPTANKFINDPSNKHVRPEGNPGGDFPFVQNDFDDSAWEKVDLPHDWAIKGPFQTGWDSEVGGGMGRLPSNGVAWYRKKLDISSSDAGKSIFLDIDGAMSYAIVWFNGHLVGGWPYGYNSWRVDLTPFIVPGGGNQLAIRVDNPNHSARWYPGGGIYRNVWLVKTNPVHIAQWGTYIATSEVSKTSALVHVEVNLDNDAQKEVVVSVITKIYKLGNDYKIAGAEVAALPIQEVTIKGGQSAKMKESVTIKNPRLWGSLPNQKPNLYLAITTVWKDGEPIDEYNTQFGIRNIQFDANKGLFVNGEHVQIQGVNQHHDLGALGAAFHIRAAERQLEILRDMGCNAIRMSHNPPAPELLELTDRMGFVVIDEIFDSWEKKKTPHDFHLVFPDWSEPDARSFIRRDRNHPSIIIWSFGNEVGEQYEGKAGAEVGRRLYNIVKEEDPTRPTITAMNFAKSNMEMPAVADMIGLNYQGEGIRQDSMFEGVDRIRTKPQYDAFHAQFPNKVIISTETASAFSSRGVYLFPVTKSVSSALRDGMGGDSDIRQISSYELYAVDFGSSAEKVFKSVETHPFVAGEFVWTGWDYLGEPTPYYLSRSCYNGIIDLAGFKKDRYYLYQSHWRSNLPMVHILPHWNWPDRVGKITPVHVFTSGDEVELFLNGKSLGKKKKGEYEYRLRWDDVKYESGQLMAIAYKNGKKWAEETINTTDAPFKLVTEADRTTINADGSDLSFITVKVADKDGLVIPNADNKIQFSIEGPGKIVATDNGDPTNMDSFAATSRNAFSGLCLVIVKGMDGKSGAITLKAESENLNSASITIKSE